MLKKTVDTSAGKVEIRAMTGEEVDWWTAPREKEKPISVKELLQRCLPKWKFGEESFPDSRLLSNEIIALTFGSKAHEGNSPSTGSGSATPSAPSTAKPAP